MQLTQVRLEAALQLSSISKEKKLSHRQGGWAGLSTTEKKKVGKKGKEGPKGYHPRRAQKLIFHIRTVKRNRNEIEAQRKSDFEQPTKFKKMKENKRK